MKEAAFSMLTNGFHQWQQLDGLQPEQLDRLNPLPAVQALLRSGELGSKVREEKHTDGQHKPEKAI